MRVRTNLSSVVASVGKGKATPPRKAQVGRVYGVVTTENTPTAAMFKKAGGFNGIGSVFYLDFQNASFTNPRDRFLSKIIYLFVEFVISVISGIPFFSSC